MTRKRKRLVIVLGAMAALGIGTWLVLSALSDNIALFKTPSDIAQEKIAAGRRFRIGGMVEEHSVARGPDGVTITFRVTDLTRSLPVSYRGILPDLFREGQGVVANGQLDASGVFQASEILAKHDERYMPPELAKAMPQEAIDKMKQSGIAREKATP